LATCPHCKGHLTDGHRCPRRTSFVAAEIIGSALLGGVASWLILAAFDPRGQVNLDLIAFLIGALVAVGINRFVRS
jgi:hypothetical protein